MKYAKQRDANEAEIVAVLRAYGCSVAKLDGAGLPDLLVGYAGQTILVEVKDPKKRKTGTAQSRNSIGGRGELRPAQAKFHDEWRGSPIYIVHSVAEALAAVPVAGTTEQ